MTTVSNYEPCLDYKVPFDDTGESKNTIKIYADRRTNFYMRVLGGNSAEELFFTIKDFEHKADTYGIDDDEKLLKFPTILGASARTKWRAMLRDLGPNPFPGPRTRHDPDQTTPWEKARLAFIQYWVEDPRARETILASFIDNSRRFIKPAEVEVRDHEDRISLICDYIDMLEKDKILDRQERTNIFFNTFPRSWKEEFQDTAKDIATASTRVVREYMTRKKKKLDREHTSNERKKEKKEKKTQSKSKEACKIHGANCGHSWSECRRNPRNGGRGSGRGRGRFGGRGRGFGGRGFGRGYNNNDSNSQYSGRNYQRNNNQQGQNYYNDDNSTIHTKDGYFQNGMPPPPPASGRWVFQHE